jgi:hypothetical protein
MDESLGSDSAEGDGRAVSITAAAACLPAGCLAVAWNRVGRLRDENLEMKRKPRRSTMSSDD